MYFTCTTIALVKIITVSHITGYSEGNIAVEFQHFLMYNAYSFTSIVGLPRESKILRAKHFRIGIIVAAKFAGHQPPEKRRHTKNKTRGNLHMVCDESSYLLTQLYHVKTTCNNTPFMNNSAMNKYSIYSTVKSSIDGESV